MAKRFSWTQPICNDCWYERYPGREPSRLLGSEPEICVECGFGTQSGIFIRIDPATARFPTRRD